MECSIISTRLDTALSQLNGFTNDLLTTNISQSLAKFLGDTIDPITSLRLIGLQEAFQELYLLMSLPSDGLDNVPGHSVTSKLNSVRTCKVDSLKLLQLVNILTKVTSFPTSASDKTNDDPTVNYIIITLERLISVYLLLVIYHHLSSKLLDLTVNANEQLIYWDRINNSTLNKWIYILQQSPIKLYNIARSILLDFRSTLSSLLTEDENLAYAEFQASNTREATLWSRNTEEDNDVYHFAVRVNHLVRLFWRSIVKTVSKITESLKLPVYLLYKMNNVFKLKAGRSSGSTFLANFSTYQKIIFGAPLEAVNSDLTQKRHTILHSIDSVAHSLGLLIHILPNQDFLEYLSSYIEAETSTDLVHETVSVFEGILCLEPDNSSATITRLHKIASSLATWNNKLPSTKVPPFALRYWPILSLLVIYGPSSSLNIYANRVEIMQWVKINLFDTITGFYSNWVVKPITDMLSVIRHDDSNSELSITTKESLQSDLDSLERMVIDYAVDYNLAPGVNADIVKGEIRDAVKQGNLTVLMTQYEQDLKHPYKAIVKGSLPRALLIQLQKTKVDGGTAINGIDKLLKSQQLVFGMVSVSPSLFLLYTLYNFVQRNVSEKPILVDGKELNFVCLKSLNNIERLLSTFAEVSSDQQIYTEGFLLIETTNLKRQSLRLLPKAVHEMWLKDLNDLNDREWSIDGRLRAVSRIWSVYGRYFK